jgi:uncharacterized protein GlcG (DUF336 family)
MAERLARAAVAAARAKALNPMSISVIDASGHLKFALREDGAGLAGVDIALGKARAALTFGCTSRQIADALAGNPLAGPSVMAVLQGRVALLPGAVLVMGLFKRNLTGIGNSDAVDNAHTRELAANACAILER